MRIQSLSFVLFVLGVFLSLPLLAQVETQETKQDSIVEQNEGNEFEPLFFKALSERGIENYDKAIEILIELKKTHGDEAVVHFQLGLNYFDTENFTLALESLEQANTLKPDNDDIKEAMFRVYEQQKNYNKAIELAQNLALTRPEYHKISANLYLITEQYEMALKSLQKADEAEGFDIYKDQIRAVIFEEYQKPEVAVDYYNKRIAQEPYNPLNYYRLISFLIESKNYEDAIAATESALVDHPGFTRFYVLKTEIYTELNQVDNALEALETVVTDKFLEEKYKVEAINHLKSYVETHPEAEDDFVQLLNLASQTAKDNASFLDLGLYYFETDKARSLENFEKAKTQNPQDFQILKYICVLNFQLDQYEEAIEISNEALEIYPTQAIFLLIKGESLVMQTQYNEAKTVLLEALSYVFEENEMMQKIYESLSRAFQGVNDPEAAKDYQQKADAVKSKLN
jgi:tetratricopeptide (TPR) repeat protein